MKHPFSILLIFVLLSMSGCTAAASPTASPTPKIPASPTPTPEPTLTPTPVSPPESFSKNKSQLVREGYSVVKGEDGWRITAKDEKDKEVEVATAVSEEKIEITVNGETKEFSQEAFVPMILNGDTVYLLTIQENGQNVDYFYIKETGEWVIPIEIQKNPEDIDAYTVITKEDVWSGRVLYTHILDAENRPFSSEAAVPQAIYYNVKAFPGGKVVVLSAYFDDGTSLLEANNWMEWGGYYSVQESNKDPIAFGILRTLNPGGKSSSFQPIGFSEEWLRSDEGREWIIERVFIGTKSKQWLLSAIVYFDGPCEYATSFNSQNPVCDYYGDENNNPSLLIRDFPNRYNKWKEYNPEDNGVSNEELFDFQKRILAPFPLGFLPKK